MRQVIPLATSVVTLIGIYLVGQKKALGWAVGLANQGLWAIFIVEFRAFGLLPLSVALSYLYARNLSRWRREPWDAPLARASLGDGTSRWADSTVDLTGDLAHWADLYAKHAHATHGWVTVPAATFADLLQAVEDGRRRNVEMAMALHFTQEYVGDDVLPPVPGWSWWEALRGTPFERPARPGSEAPFDQDAP